MRQAKGLLLTAIIRAVVCTMVLAGSEALADGTGLSGELIVSSTLTITDSAAGSGEAQTIPPGRYVGRLDKLKRYRLVIDLDTPDHARLTLNLSRDSDGFPLNGGEFWLSPSQHDLPYAVMGNYSRSEEVVRTGRRALSGTSCSNIADVDSIQSTAELVLVFLDPSHSETAARFYGSGAATKQRSVPYADDECALREAAAEDRRILPMPPAGPE